MRRNGGIIGPLQEPSAENAGDVKIFDNHDRHIRGSASWPDIAGITGISQTAVSYTHLTLPTILLV